MCFFNSDSFGQVNSDEEDQVVIQVVGGANTHISVVPWQVLLEINGNDDCGGTIIAPNWILTACHCLENPNGPILYQPSQIKVHAGVTRRSQKNLGQLRNVVQIIRHPNWNRNTLANDIALLRLSSPLTINNNVQSIRYATANDAVQGFTNPGVNARISGWGSLANGA